MTQRPRTQTRICTPDKCQQGRAPCPCPQACQPPDPTSQHAHRWHLAGNTPHQPAPQRLSLLAHMGVVLACIALLAIIAISAPSP